jgi:hypothetical protein
MPRNPQLTRILDHDFPAAPCTLSHNGPECIFQLCLNKIPFYSDRHKASLSEQLLLSYLRAGISPFSIAWYTEILPSRRILATSQTV